MKQKVVLAFSGGLDTSFCVPYLINKRNLEVHTVIVNTGGFSNKVFQTRNWKELKSAPGSWERHPIQQLML